MYKLLGLISLLLFSGASLAELPRMKDFLNHPDYPDSFWQTSTPSSVGLSEVRLEQAVTYIQQEQLEIHSFSIIKDGKLVFDYYGTEQTPEQQWQRTPSDVHELHSTTKTITSALIGIAMEEGLLGAVETPALSYLPQFKEPSLDKAKRAISLDDVLTMRTGFQYQEGVDDDPIFFNPENSASAIFARPLIHKPGTSWNYSSADSQILSEILTTVTQGSTQAYAQKRLFSPLGISKPKWLKDKSGTNYGGWGLFLTPRDLARIGYTFLNQGLWQGQQVIPHSWVTISTQPHTPTYWTNDYGYHIWLPQIGGYATSGYMGQNMYILPKKKMIVLFTAALPPDQAGAIQETIITRYLLD